MKNIINKSVALFLAVAFSTSLFLILDGTPLVGAQENKASLETNVVSLVGIESIKNQIIKTNDEFNILEVVPKENTGIMGYFVGGSEPFDFQGELEDKDKEDREEYFDAQEDDGFFKYLKDRGILSNTTETPLTSTGEYSEILPWENHSGTIEVILKKSEEYKIDFELDKVNDKSGDFSQREIDINIVDDDDDDATHYQKVDKLVYGQSSASGGVEYYYKDINWGSFEIVKDMENPDEILEANADKKLYVEEDGKKVYVGYLGKDFYVSLNETKTYYFLESLGKPEEDYSNGSYMAVHDDFITEDEVDANNPYISGKCFEFESAVYDYVGDGGDYVRSDKTIDEDYEAIVYTNRIYIKPFTNNEWFLKNVLDATASQINDIDVTVNSKKIDEVYMSDITRADLIVISSGYNYKNGKLLIGDYTGKDFSEETYNHLRAVTIESQDKPVVSLTGNIPGDSNISKLLNAYKALKNVDNFAKDNVLYYSESDDLPSIYNLELTNKIEESNYNGFNAPFYPVIETIRDQNFQREFGSIGKLDETVSIATSIRHIINRVAVHIDNKKEKIKILEIQPLNGCDTNGVSQNSQLTKENILENWLEGSSLEADDIEIVVMGVGEFVGKIEDINEIYDLVYIGSNITGFNQSAGQTVFNDVNMNGTIYSNIGDISCGKPILGGFLDTDFSGSMMSDKIPVRYSGNDITPKKMAELINFADSGFPIILNDDLVGEAKKTPPVIPGFGAPLALIRSMEGANTRFKFATENSNGSVIALSDNGENRNRDFYAASGGYTYEWELSKGNGDFESAPTADEKSVEPTLGNDSSERYRCIITSNTGKQYITEIIDSKGFDTNETPFFYEYDPIKDEAISTIVVPSKAIDNCSLLYETFSGDPRNNSEDDGILVLPNVMSEADAKADNKTLIRYLNISKPILNILEKPSEYNGNIETTGKITNNTVRFEIEIENPTDPTPFETKYEPKLYIDQNADGRFDDTEVISNLQIKDLETGNSVSTVSAVTDENSRQKYSIQRVLPTTIKGCVPWKLEVVKVGQADVHNSATGISYIKPSEIITLNILQIIDEDDSVNTNNAMNLEKNALYNGYFDELKNANVYDIQIEAKYLNEINRERPAGAINTANSAAQTWPLRTQEDVYNELNKYSMIIVGFGDNFGCKSVDRGVTKETALAIKQYIETGKSVLFSHDTTGVFNVDNKDMKTTWTDAKNSDAFYLYEYNGPFTLKESYSQYYFNTLLRNDLGIDRYGVTAEGALGDQISSGSGFSTGDISSTNEIVNNGYTVAYQPQSNRTVTVPQTQGFIDTTIEYLNHNDTYKVIQGMGELTKTNKVSQVNKGQITSYPYDINTKGFGGTDLDVDVVTTHAQYFQLNMNADDITTWYSLSGNGYKNLNHNDVTNSYYIYNCGNVTYTGAGHDGAQSSKVEAELFVNTMIAAYRAGSTAPELEFQDVGTDNKIESVYLPAEISNFPTNENDEATIVDSFSEDFKKVAFMVTDRNTKEVLGFKAELYIEDTSQAEKIEVDGETIDNPARWQLITGAIDSTAIQDKTQYVFTLPQTVLDKLSADLSCKIKVRVRTILKNEAEPTGEEETAYNEAKLTVTKLGFLPLS